MGLLDNFLLREKLIARTVEIEDELFERMEKIVPHFQDCSISKIINYSIYDFANENRAKIEIGNMGPTFKHSVTFRETALEELSTLADKYKGYKYVILNIAIRAGVEKLEKRIKNKK